MLSERFTDSLNGLVFPRKLFLLASSDEVQSVNWARDGTTVEIHSILLCEECFHPKIFNVKSNQHVLRQLSYYKFVKLDQKKRLWEFNHHFFQEGREDLLPLIKRTPQRVPKKFAKDVERRCSPRIRSLASTKKRPQIYDDAETEDDDMGLYAEQKPSAKKLKYAEEEYIPNYYRDSYYNNATTAALSSSTRNSNSNVAGNSKSNSKSKVEESNGCPPIKKKRGRPRKNPLPTTVSNGPSSTTRMDAKYEDLAKASTSREYLVKTAPSPSAKFYHDCLNADWRCEKFDLKDKNPVWKSDEVYLPNLFTENAKKQVLVGYPKKIYQTREDKNGNIEFNVGDKSFFHGMDMDKRIPQTDVSDCYEEPIGQNNLSPTSAENERPPLLITLSNNEFKGNEIGEIRYGMNKDEYHDENRIGEKLRSSNSAIMDGIQNQNYERDGAKMIPTNEFQLPVDNVCSSQKVESRNETFLVSNYTPQNYLGSNSNWEMVQRSKEKPTTSSALSLFDKSAISPQQLPDFQRIKLFNKLDQVNFGSDAIDEVYNCTPQPGCSYTGDFPKYALSSYACFNNNPSGFLAELKSGPRIHDDFIYDLTDLDDTREDRKNNLKDSSKIDQNRKASQSCVVLPVSNESQQQSPLSTPEHHFDSACTTNSDHNYCGGKFNDSFLNVKPETSEAIPQNEQDSKNGNIGAVSQPNFQDVKHPNGDNELVNPSSKFKETKYHPNGVHVDMEQYSNVDSLANSPSRQDSSVPTFEQNLESDVFSNVSHELIDLIDKFDYSNCRLEEDSDVVEILKQIDPLQNHVGEYLMAENSPNARAGGHCSGCVLHSEDPRFESASNNFGPREGKPLRLIEFLGEQLQGGKIYTWDFVNADIVIKGGAVDFIEWCSRTSTARLNGFI